MKTTDPYEMSWHLRLFAAVLFLLMSMSLSFCAGVSTGAIFLKSDIPRSGVLLLGFISIAMTSLAIELITRSLTFRRDQVYRFICISWVLIPLAALCCGGVLLARPAAIHRPDLWIIGFISGIVWTIVSSWACKKHFQAQAHSANNAT